ncbi:hypothetical protein [Tautonia plasticadhaerens]|uniref:Uncharacterized protein n=1 Tax=Tautonia plasticadhaerens TaxID=2527974 RepID=A0A518GXB6_9BACT|nr:hypothetical protein [Tautonia plasticadhaerens]QDV33236.1 hypothetical protein ElP_10780 [Tautonia plasticadhaerens]
MIRTALLPITMTLALAVGLAPSNAAAQQAQRAAQGGSQAVEAQWLDQLPGDLPIIVRIGGIGQATDNFVTMLRAMSPEAAEQVGSQIQATVSEFTRSLGAGQGEAPALLLIDVVPPGQLGQQISLQGGQLQVKPRAIAVFATSDYDQALSAIAGKEDAQKQTDQGVDSITAANGETVYAVNKQGFAAISQHEDLIRKVSSAPQQTLAQTIDEGLRSYFLDGDIGMYVDLAAITETYGDEIDQAQNFLKAQTDRAAEQGADFTEQAQFATQQLFKAAKNARAVASHATFAEQGLTISGKLAMNEDYEPIRRMAEAGDSPAEELATLPRGNAYYSFDVFDPEAINWELIPGANEVREYLPEIAKVMESPEFQKAQEQFRAAGKATYIATLGLGETRTGLSVMKAENSESVVEAVRSAVAAVKGKDFALIKELNIEQGAQDYQGYSFDKITAAYDFDAFTKEVEAEAKKLQPEAAEGQQGEQQQKPIDREEAVEVLRKVVGESTTVWVGSNGEQVVNLLAANWEDAQKQLDAYLADDQGIGQTESFKKVRAQLPDRVRSLYMVDMQTGTRQVLAEARQATGDQDLRAGQEMPEQPAMVGLAVVAEPDGLRFTGFVPSEVGPVIEKGIVPLVEQQLNQQQDN